jgi:hypothetical protein
MTKCSKVHPYIPLEEYPEAVKFVYITNHRNAAATHYAALCSECVDWFVDKKRHGIVSVKELTKSEWELIQMMRS